MRYNRVLNPFKKTFMQPELQIQEKEKKEELTFEEKIAIFDEKLETIGLEPYNKIGKIPLLTRQEEAEINIKIQEGDTKYKDYLIIANIRLVIKIASRINTFQSHFHNFEKEDLIQEGVDGLIRAVEMFDHTKGYKFSTYAVHWIEQRIGRAIDTKGKHMKYPAHFATKFGNFVKTNGILTNELDREPTTKEIAEKMGVTLEMAELLKTEKKRTFISLDERNFKNEEDSSLLVDQLEDSNAKKPEEEALKQIQKTEMQDALKILNKREQLCITLIYGLNGENPMNRTEIEKTYGINRQKVREIELRALRKLRQDFFNKEYEYSK